MALATATAGARTTATAGAMAMAGHLWQHMWLQQQQPLVWSICLPGILITCFACCRFQFFSSSTLPRLLSHCHSLPPFILFFYFNSINHKQFEAATGEAVQANVWSHVRIGFLL